MPHLDSRFSILAPGSDRVQNGSQFSHILEDLRFTLLEIAQQLPLREYQATFKCSTMLTTISDRSLIGGPLYFEVPVNELTSSDFRALSSKPKRKFVKVKLYSDDVGIPICKDEHRAMIQSQIHPEMSSQAYCICNHIDDGLVAHFRGVISHDYIHTGGSLDLLADEVRPRLIYQLSKDYDMSVYKLLTKLVDIQYHIAIR